MFFSSCVKLLVKYDFRFECKGTAITICVGLKGDKKGTKT